MKFGGGFVIALLILVIASSASAGSIKNVTDENGVSGLLIEDHTSPLISLAIAFKAGWAYDKDGMEGTSQLLSGMLDEGAGHLSSQAFQEELADRGIDLTFESQSDEFVIRTTFLTDEKAPTLDLLYQAIAHPRFDTDALSRVKRQLEASLKQDLNDPGELALVALQRLIFPNHAYGSGGQYSEESLKKITPDDLRHFMKTHFTRESLYIAAVGDITEAEFSDLISKLFHDLDSDSGKNKKSVKQTIPAFPGGATLIKRDIPQSAIAFAAPGLDIKDPDYYAYHLLNYILGGGDFSSRLMQEIRTKRGLTYGISTTIVALDQAAYLGGTLQTKNASVVDAITLIREIWGDLAENGPTSEELENAKTYVIGSYPLHFATLGSAASTLLGLQITGVGIDYPTARNDLFNAVTIEDIRRVAKKLLDPEKLTFVVTGNPAPFFPTPPSLSVSP